VDASNVSEIQTLAFFADARVRSDGFDGLFRARSIGRAAAVEMRRASGCPAYRNNPEASAAQSRALSDERTPLDVPPIRIPREAGPAIAGIRAKGVRGKFGPAK
jgi:hypothetical protein